MDSNYEQYDNNGERPFADNDFEMGNAKAINQMMRLGFIRKVYGILSLQLSITVLFVSLAFNHSVSNFLQNNLVIFWCCLGLSLMIAIPLVCCKNIARKVPLNYILLFLWTMCESYMVATCASFYDPYTVITAGAMTAIVTIALTVYAFYTKTDFTYCGALLFICSALMFCWTLFSICFGIYLNALYCVLGVLLYSLYLIYDTQLVMGKFGLEYTIDDYIVAALYI